MTLYQETKNYKLVISALLESKIRILCERINTLEWSGVVFYTTEGSFEEDNLVIKADDLFLMHKGTAGFTEFEVTADIAHYMAMNDMIQYKMGLIHSHNNMSTFFSGTDQNTLKELGSKQRHFFSLIVNNAGKYTAAITKAVTKKRKVEETRLIYTYGDAVIEASTPEYKEEEVSDIHYHELDIEYELNYDDFLERLDEIEKTSVQSTPTYTNYGGYGNYGYRSYRNYGSYTSSKNEPKYSGKTLKEYDEENPSIYSKMSPYSKEEIEELFPGLEDTPLKQYSKEDIENDALKILKSIFLGMDKISTVVSSDLEISFNVFNTAYSANIAAEVRELLYERLDALVYELEDEYPLNQLFNEMRTILYTLRSTTNKSILLTAINMFEKDIIK